ncbi:MAG: hypothetical protein ACE5Q6_14605, partial [Dehalococcoidia bacterium]
AQEILTTHKPKLVQVAEYLIEHEAVSGDDLNRLFNAGDSDDEPGVGAVPTEPPPYAPKPTAPTFQPSPTMTSQNRPATEGVGGDVDD